MAIEEGGDGGGGEGGDEEGVTAGEDEVLEEGWGRRGGRGVVG